MTAEVVATLTRYLALCDVPAGAAGPPTDLSALGDLFTEDAVWEGGGSDYAAKFGRTEGRAAIVTMLAGYLPPSPHFRANVHLLFPGTAHADADGSSAHGSWLMQQLSRYDSGQTEVMVARLDVSFRLAPDRPRMSAFRTERLFSAPLREGP
ncbi:nuclear transport factor 2 family protein [Streptomyces scopuliridis]|uniref:nuclear transport factor 2 family protein n=1 Tax=Streptomyces scopuliridis TaxID=452529 RepID=UPI0036CFC8E1